MPLEDAPDGVPGRFCLLPFSMHLFRLDFSKQNSGEFFHAAGRPQAASMPHRAEPAIHGRFPLGIDILPRKIPPETKHGKQGIEEPPKHSGRGCVFQA